MAGLLRKLASAWADAPQPPHLLVMDNREVVVNFRKNAQAKRIVLRLDRSSTGVMVTLPKAVSRARALAFVEKSIPWISKQFELRKPQTLVSEGSTIPLRGVLHEVRCTGKSRGLISVDQEQRIIFMPGDPKHLQRRLRDWFKALAKEDLTAASHHYAQAMEVKLGRISIRDQKSRWGSCAASGDLSYSWRLILAPAFVLDYVAAHEVAHRQQMNHGPKFWRLVLRHCPRASEAKQWFTANGADLHRLTL